MAHTNASEQDNEARAPAKRTQPAGGGQNIKTVTVRVLLSLCGLTLLIGFFLPWIHLGKLVEVSGFTLTVSGGEVVDMVSGPHRVVPLAVPALGVLLVVGAVMGHRLVQWIAVVTGIVVLGYGFFTLLRFFLDTTGIGIWLVAAASLVSLGTGLLGIGSSRR